MKRYYVIGDHYDEGEKIFFTGSASDCLDWIWDNCDVADLRREAMRAWSGVAYFDEDNKVYAIQVDKFYKAL